MRALWLMFGLAAATAFVLAGCTHTDPTKPPRPPEVFSVPPNDDARYSQPPKFPKELLNTERVPVALPAGGNSGPIGNPRAPRTGAGAGSY